MKQEEAEITEINSLFPLSTLLSKEPAMHPLFAQAAGMTRDVIGAAIEVHKDKGPGLLGASDPQSLIAQLHETTGHPLGTGHQFSRSQVDRGTIEMNHPVANQP